MSKPGGARMSQAPTGRVWLCLNLTQQGLGQIKRSKLSYCLGVFSVLFVVVVSAVVQTLLAKAPLVNMRQAEFAQSQTDLRLEPSSFATRFALNYSQLADLATTASSDYEFSSPRVVLEGRALPMSSCSGTPPDFTVADDNAWMYATDYYAGENPPSQPYAQCDGSRSDRIATVLLSDTDRELAIGQGRAWPFAPLQPGRAVIRQDNADSLGVGVGDIVLARVSAELVLRHAFAPAGASASDTAAAAWTERVNQYPTIMIPLEISGILSSWDGKLADEDANFFVVEYSTFIEYAASRLDPAIRFDASNPTDPDRASITGNMYHWASQVTFNFPPDIRLDQYTESDFANIQSNVIEFGTTVMYALGFTELDPTMPMLSDLEESRFTGVYLTLLLSILLVVLASLSALLIYSLLMINVQGRTFELAVRRTLGASKRVIGFMLFFQAMSFAVPAWAIGLLIARGLVEVVLKAFDAASGIPVSPELSANAVLLATALAFLTPIVASVGPIRSALSTSLRDALDVDRPKSTAVKFKIERAETKGVNWSVVSFGMALTLFGFIVYYGIPLALLTLNLTFFINIFLWILISMLFGMVLLAVNLELTVSRALTWALLWWEAKVVTQLALSNLIAHRQRNRKTLMMFALSVSFIVFLSVASNQQIQGAVMFTRQVKGAPLGVELGDAVVDFDTVRNLDTVLTSPEVAPLVKSFGWVTRDLDNQQDGEATNTRASLRNVGLLYGARSKMYGAAPHLFESMYGKYLRVRNRGDSGLPLAEQMYSIKGSQSAGLSGALQFSALVEQGEDFVYDTEQDTGGDLDLQMRTRLNARVTLNTASWFKFSEYPDFVGDDCYTSMPTLLRMLGARGYDVNVETMNYRKLLILPEDGLSDSELDFIHDSLLVAFRDSPYDWEVDDVRDATENLETTLTILNFFFATLTIVAMALCFFSLLSSMMANIAEQTKEIGILRALGLPPSQLVRVYVHEAFILVLTASLMGVAIGTAAAWTFDQQRALFTGLPLVIVIPWGIIITVLVVAMLSAMLASCSPARRLLKPPITKLLRHV